jgi:hypothetical protein
MIISSGKNRSGSKNREFEATTGQNVKENAESMVLQKKLRILDTH